MYSIRAVQRALRDYGYDPGPTDGVRGRRTIAAIKAFQAANGLEVDGLVGPKTTDKLFPGKKRSTAKPATDAIPWFDLARRKMGLHETRDNKALRAFLASDKRALGDPSKLPWCGDFVETCIAVPLPDERLPANPYLARNWLKFGGPVSPQLGAVLVFWRGSKSGSTGHVGFYAGEDASAFHVLGGNQSNAVSIARIACSRLLGARWPVTALPPAGITRTAGRDRPLSRDEA